MFKDNENLSRVRHALHIDVKNTGAAAVQIAKLQFEITALSEKHFSKHKKDNHSKLGLYKKISAMKAMEKYLSKQDPVQYKALCVALGRKIKH